MFNFFKKKDDNRSIKNSNIFINNKKKFSGYSYDRVMNLYNEILFYINETEKNFYYDYYTHQKNQEIYKDCNYECFTNYENGIDWEDGYYVGRKYGNIYRNAYTDIVVFEYYIDCYFKEFETWLIKYGFLTENERERFNKLIDNNIYCHLCLDNGYISYKKVTIRELIKFDLNNYDKKKIR